MSNQCPPISDKLIAYLEATYPEYLPNKYEGEFQMGKLFGAAYVVRHLKSIRDEQREDMLDQSVLALGE